MWLKYNLKSVFNVGELCIYWHCFAIYTLFDRSNGDSMKIAFGVIAGLAIGVLIAISAFQLLKILIKETAGMAAEAWQRVQL
jgi:glycerol-3-phosphate acyltransferase PlsY